ncbi:MAG: SCO6745 family protein [Ilumatobacteraceae bacterium]
MSAVPDSIRRLTAPVGDLGGRWMLHPEVLGPCRQIGYPNGYAYYVAGRGGVLGDVDADVVSSAFGFFAPSIIRRMWDEGVAVEGARAAAARYGAACADFGRARLSGFGGAGRLAELAGAVVAGCDSTGLSLFAGWRSEPLPDDALARAFFLIHVLRELRGSAHIVAVVSSGLTPLEAVLATAGTAGAERFGWTGPFPDVAADAKAAAELLTDQIVARCYRSVLGDAEIDELATLVAAARSHVDAAGV